MAETIVTVGIDIGGTFTDFWVFDGQKIRQHKVLSTPGNPEKAVLQGLKELEILQLALIIHGSTIATNAFLERKGAKVALVTTRGFEDVLEIGRQNRIGIYDLHVKKPDVLVPQEGRFGVTERMDWQGQPLVPLTQEEIEKLGKRLQSYNPEAIAIVFLHSYVNGVHEEHVVTSLRQQYPYVFASSHVNPEHREYERTSTTVISAYVAPVVSRYLEQLSETLGSSLRVMSSAGGYMSAKRIIEQPAAMMLSGPAGGVVASFELARALGYERIVTFDMGGTSTDVAMIQGRIPITRDMEFDHLPLRSPMVDIHTVGAGGGSMASFDRGGNLRVGPQSAGSFPGPACYGQGGMTVTVTDANFLLGRLDQDNFLGGKMILDRNATHQAFQTLIDQGLKHGVEMTDVALAEGIIEVVNAAMARAIRRVTAMKGVDPAQFVLLSFGGAGGLHAADLAAMLGIQEVLIPPDAGTFSAQGLARSQAYADALASVLKPTHDLTLEYIQDLLEKLADKTVKQLADDGHRAESITSFYHLDLRYQGESYEILTPWQGTLKDTVDMFHQLHEQYYLHKELLTPVECVNLYVRSIAEMRTIPLPLWQNSAAAKPFAHRPMVFKGESLSTPCYRREELSADQRIFGPALVIEPASTILIPPHYQATVDHYGIIHITQ
ncbi:N-methylhydantoinase A [Sulfobacillus thermosulfidooxidans DSM 9293]|uniref:N-methylhydantoinase A n=1 Tax=Sulfobacillus thermosulfidooxidans (strain DSM 9293 / VKM B-1269 / AT-1) TaxID=929705 RepID=A0A1W1WED3_SULTA|nr:hydantoinase/oxoprolinase family protein [Sulfobacillus thermosulfidooxidans]SMC04658.1 N-methylhydantoinase A [Sulfobacillus thermosulfidooxidans DSM 9293]